MRSFPFIACIVAAVLLCVIPLTLSCQGCAGNKARDNVAVPALVLASTGLQGDVRMGITTLPTEQFADATTVSDSFFSALATKDRATIVSVCVPKWPSVKAWALSGIEMKKASGAIGPDVVLSLRERVKNFDELLTKTASGS